MASRLFPALVLALQLILIIIYGVFGSYEKLNHDDLKLYGYFQDVHIMIFVGFGFLMTFLKRYGFGAVGFNLLIAALAIQWCIVMEGMLHSLSPHFHITFTNLLTSDIGAAAVLISFGAVLGRLEPSQLLIMAVIEITLFALNMFVGQVLLGAADAGGSIFVHTFGAYFGLSVARTTYHRSHDGHRFNGSIYHSDVFAMVGTVFLWVCWPSFNAALVADEAGQYRAIVNTYLSLAACTMVTFAVSALVEHNHKVDMVHVQNATLAGGVAVGAVANFCIQPWGALVPVPPNEK